MKYRIRFSLSIFLALLLSACDGDVQSSSHDTRTEAIDYIERGWIPSVLPESATGIHEWHNVDTNNGHGTFSFAADDSRSFKEDLTSISSGRKLPSNASYSALESQGYVFYIYEDFEIAVKWKDRKGQFWLGQAR